MIPATTSRVPENTAGHVNEQIRQRTLEHISHYADADRATLDRRLAELDHEWDIERALEANAASVTLVGAILAAFVSPWFLLIPAFVGAFLLEHAVQGWCPPVPVFRRLGFRTQTEIEQERYALKVLRGDFDRLPKRFEEPAEAVAVGVLEAVER